MLNDAVSVIRYATIGAISFVGALVVATVARNLNRWSVLFASLTAAAVVALEAITERRAE